MSSNPDDNFKVFEEAVARNGGNVLSLPSAGMVRNFKSRFLGDCPEGVWLEATGDALPLLRQLQEMKHPAAVSFKGTTLRLDFTATVVQIDPEYRINAQTVVPAVLLTRPQKIVAVQRRAAYRVRVYPEAELSAKLWAVPEKAVITDRPSATLEIQFELRDISTGGLGVRLAERVEGQHPLVADQRVRVQLNYRDIELVLEARMRTIPKAAGAKGPSITGVVFKKLEAGVEGRQQLASLQRIVGEMQREEVRKMRLGLAS